MLSRRQPSLPITLYSLLLCALPALGHMEMSWPYPFRSKFNPDNTAANIDYSMTSPLSPDGSDFPCKGYQNDRPIETVATYSAGSTYNITLAGSATHKGGSCQISLSYDNGATFRVIQSMIGGCPLTSTYDFDVPSYAPSGQALLAWTWQNEEGNREFYMNCAAVNVVSGAYRRRRRQAIQSFDQLPFIWKANLEGINDCTTTEGDDPVYPNPGPAVEYGNGYSSTSTPSPGTCDSATPYGQTYKDLGDSTLAPPSSTESNTTSEGSAESYSNDTTSSAAEPSSEPKPTQYDSDDSMTESWNHGPGVYQTGDASSGTHGRPGSGSDDSATEAWNNRHTAAPTAPPRGRPVSTDTRSTVTVTADCASTVIITVYPSVTAFPSTSARPSTMTTRASPTPSPTSNPRPPYATGSIESINAQYLPCTANTFLCTSRTTFLTCNYNDGTVNSDQTWVYSSRTEKTVAAGTECLPYLSPSGRDDRYIRARPDGDCDVDGSFKCSAGGTQFLICDHGGWVAMGAVAAGTSCEDGKIVAAR